MNTNTASQMPQDSARFLGLRLSAINKSFSGNQVLRNVSLFVGPGEVVALLGENGAGKSTLSSIALGIVQPDSGEMEWQGTPYRPQGPRDSASAGIGLIHQEMKLLPDLSIAENVFLGRLPMRGGHVDWPHLHSNTEALLQRVGLQEPSTRLVRRLTIAAQQQVEVAKALSLDAQVLIFDEPTAALGARETDQLFRQIDQLRREGVGCVYISHRLEEIARIADRIYVLRDGEVIASHDTSKVEVNTLLREMVGRNVDRIFPEPTEPAADVVLKVEGLRGRKGVFRDVSFDVRAGEVFGIAGIVGAKRTDLVRAIAGLDPLEGGTIRVKGELLHLTGPQDAIAAGVALVPEDRKAQGLLLERSMAENIALGNLDRLASDGWCRRSRFRKAAEDAIRTVGIRGKPDQLIRFLSGGNQQKVVIARWVSRNPAVFILDEPTRGIDMGARAAIYELIADLSRRGMAVVVVSSDLEEVLGLSHRVMVLNQGRQMAILDRDTATNVRVMELATR